ncbi:hypothetical protein HUN88_04220 [Bacillus amyloliquefaciens]|uniref:hypothetical protein n=1 Tax=Bacillus amyloliquefaciens TaxID=1390 RepID=UPI00157FEF55|nr:hypothetical protein [Bacillus amyloliquefaciens]NUI58974.1 hypothetical protein [Bacillus amyloliquefaciens]
MSLFYSLFAALMIVGIFMGLCLVVLNSTRKFGIQLTIGCLSILLLMSLANRFIFKFGDEHEAAITPQTFHKIKEGMTYEEVKKIVGGKARSESNLYAGSKEYVYSGKDGLESGSTVTLEFDDDELNFISETGLISKREDEQNEDENTTTVIENETEEDQINDLVENNLKNVSVDKIELNQDMSKNKEKQYIALVHLSFNLKNTPERAKKITQTYSEDLAARISDKVKSVDQLIIFWKIPYLNDNAVLAKNSYVRSGSHFIIADQAYQPPLQ